MAYASGKYTLALCDRCGQRYYLNKLIKEWTGLKVCPSCYEPKHTQLEPHPHPEDAQAVYEPRVDRVEPLVVTVGRSKTFPEVKEDTASRGRIGTVTVIIS